MQKKEDQIKRFQKDKEEKQKIGKKS